jgi:NitT/TauT family transport system substrate-binding protein
MKRRDFVRTASVGAGSAMLAATPLGSTLISVAQAQAARTLDIQLLGFGLAIMVPATAAIMSILPSMKGYAPPKTARINVIRMVTQTMVGGAADIGESDPPTVLAAIEAGAPLKIVGKPYNSSSLTMVVNADKVKTFADLAKPETRVAIGGKGDITHVMLIAPLIKHGVNFDKLTVLEMSGSGVRVAGLIAGRIDAGNLHFDQMESIAGKGNFKALIEPWVEFSTWTNEVWVVRSEWLKKPENERALVDFLKATVMAYRKANTDFDWYLDAFRKYATIPDAAKMTPERLRPIWQKLKEEVKAWPSDGAFSAKDIADMIPACKGADAIRGTVKAEDVVEAKYMAQAVKELG